MRVLLSQGGGGVESFKFINELFFKHFSNEILLRQEDAASLQVNGKIAFSTDSFVVSPLFFKGGDIGKLSVAGTINDLVSSGAKPLYLSCGFIIEEGFLISDLEKIVKSMQNELLKNDVKIVTGDTKVVPKGSVDGLFINTAGIGEIIYENLSATNIPPNSTIIATNEIGNHGACILSQREGLDFSSELHSDCASLWLPMSEVLSSNLGIFAIRDATRGGLSAVLNEWANSSNIGINISEKEVLVADEVRGICEFLGFEPYEFANEGTMVLSVKNEDAQKICEILSKFEPTKKAKIIGKTTEKNPKRVLLENEWGSARILEFPKGELLPRIC